MSDPMDLPTSPPILPQGRTHFGAFLRNLGTRARSSSNFSGVMSGQTSAVSTPAAKYDTAESRLHSLLASQTGQVQTTLVHKQAQQGSPATDALMFQLSSTTSEESEISTAKVLIKSVRIDSLADPADVWEKCAFLLQMEAKEARNIGIELLKTCVLLSNEETGELHYSYERQFYYAAVQSYFEQRHDLSILEMQSLVSVLEALTRGGRDVMGIEGLVPLLRHIALAMTTTRNTERLKYLENMQQASSPLLDSEYKTPFVRLPPSIFAFSQDPRASPASLLIACHRFSFHNLKNEDVSKLLSTFVRRSLQNLGEYEIQKALDLIDTIVKFGIIPAEHLEDVVKFVARATGIEGRLQVIVVSAEGSLRTEGLSGELPAKAHSVMQNLLRSPNNQALKYLRAILSSRHSSTAASACPTPLLVGALRCLRRAFVEYDSTVSIMSEAERSNERYPSVLSMGMIILQQSLLDVLDWKRPEVDAEVLLFLEERFSEKFLSRTSLSFEEWQMAITILDRVTWHIADFEKSARRFWSTDLSASGGVSKKSTIPGIKAEAAPAVATSPTSTSGASVNVHVLDVLSQVIHRMLTAQANQQFVGSHIRFYDFLLSIGRHLSGSAMVSFFNFYRKRLLYSPGRIDWLQRLQRVVSVFFPDLPLSGIQDSMSSGRRDVVKLLHEAYASAWGYFEHSQELLKKVLIPFWSRVLPGEKDSSIVTSSLSLMEACIKDHFAEAGRTATRDSSQVVICYQILDTIKTMTWKEDAQSDLGSQHDLGQKTFESVPSQESPERLSSRPARQPASGISLAATQTLISLLYTMITTATRDSASFSTSIFAHMLAVLAPSKPGSYRDRQAPTTTRLAVLQCLARLRADQRHRIWSRFRLDFDALAATVGRSGKTSEGGQPEDIAEPGADQRGRRVQRREAGPIRPDARLAHREHREESRSRTRGTTAGSSPSRVPRDPILPDPPPLWTYPDKLLYAFPKQPVRSVGSSGLVSFDHVRMRDWTESTADIDRGYETLADSAEEIPFVVLRVSDYLEVISDLLRYETNWDLVAYALCALPNQLANKHYACGPECAQQLQDLRRLLCEQLSRDTLCEQVRLPSHVRRSDVHALAYQWLATLIAYRDLYQKGAQNDMVVTFMRGLSKTPNIAKPCVHALTMACYEFEQSMSKNLPEILGALTRIMSTVNMPVHILELVASIGHIRSLYANFTEDDYKKVFALALQYLSSHYEALVDDPAGISVPEDLSKALTHAFKQYVFLLSYYIIALWYTNIAVTERPRYMGFVAQRLLGASEVMGSLDSAAEVSLDMLARLAYQNPSTNAVQHAKHRQGKKQSWIIGNSLLSIEETATAEEEVEIVIRRPSGVSKVILPTAKVQPDLDILQQLREYRARFQTPLASQLTHPGSSALSSASDSDPAFSTLFLPPHAHLKDHGPPLLVPQTDANIRATSVLDTMPHIDFHKIGVLYAGPDQTTEVQILRNVHGSKGYSVFLSGLGDLIRLKGYESNTGGLDREFDSDGKWTYIWADEIQQMIFHVPTLMPTNLERDGDCILKKRHIGNDYVKIIFNDTGRRLPFDIIPGQFNFVNILIEPHTPAGEAWRGASGIANNTEFFRVSMQKRPEMPEIGPLGMFKMVSTATLPNVVRELALHANLFAQLWLQSVGFEGKDGAAGGRRRMEYTSTWRSRLHSIQRLKESVITQSQVQVTKHNGGT